MGTNIWLLGWRHKTRLRSVAPGSTMPASIPRRIVVLFKPAFPTPFSAAWTDCRSRNRLLRHRWMWVSFAAWALGSGEQSKRTSVPQANVATRPGALAGGPGSLQGSQLLPHLLPSVPAAATGLPCVAGCLRPRGSRALSTWRQKDMELDVVCEMRGPSVAQAVSPAPSKGLGREPLLVGGFGARPVGEGWAVLRHPCEWCVRL